MTAPRPRRRGDDARTPAAGETLWAEAAATYEVCGDCESEGLVFGPGDRRECVDCGWRGSRAETARRAMRKEKR